MFRSPQVPLKPEAVQVAVIGEASREAELRSTLQHVLGGLDGQTNWLDTGQRVSRFVEGLSRLAITAGVLAVIAVAIWRAVRRGRKARGRAESGSVLSRDKKHMIHPPVAGSSDEPQPADEPRCTPGQTEPGS